MRLFLIALILSVSAKAQNLVPDPGFEDRTSADSCFTIIDTGITQANLQSFYNQPKILNHWSSPTYATSGTVNIRCNPRTSYGGTQDPIEDSTMAVIRIYNYASNMFGTMAESRTYLQTKLTDTLEENSSYRVSFYVSFTTIPRNQNFNYYSSSSIGAHLSDQRITDFKRPFKSDSTVLNFLPQITNHPDSFYSDTAEWNLICGILKANGGEVWLTIGNFYDDANTDLRLEKPGQVSSLSSDYSGYFVDLVSVEKIKNIQPNEKNRDTSVCPNQPFSMTLRARPGANFYQWSNGKSSDTILIDSVGVYWLNADFGCGIESDTFKVFAIPAKVLDLGNDIEVCRSNADSVLIAAPKGFNEYLWSSGKTSDSVWVKTSTQLALAAIYQCDTLRDTINIQINPLTSIPLVKDTTSCVGLTVTPTVIGQNLLWYDSINDPSPQSTPPNITQSFSGSQYFYVSQSIDGCESGLASGEVVFYDSVVFSLAIDTPLCDLDSIQLWTSDTLLQNIWSTSESSDTITISNSGIYWLESSNGCNTYRDSINIEFRNSPPPPIVADSSYCNKESWSVLDLPLNHIDLVWFEDSFGNGETQLPDLPPFNWVGEREYFISQEQNGCRSDIASFAIYNNFSPEINIKERFIFCVNEPIIISTDSVLGDYFWSNGSKGRVFRSDTSGLFQLKIVNKCGSDSSSFQVMTEDCSTKIQLPNVFSPNNDGINDNFFPYGQNFEVLVLKVFNRWGELVYNGSGPWDGKVNGRNASNGQFGTVLIYKDSRGETKTISGHLTLIR